MQLEGCFLTLKQLQLSSTQVIMFCLQNRSAIFQISVEPFMFLRAIYNNNQIDEVLPLAPHPVSGKFSITGKVPNHVEPGMKKFFFVNNFVVSITLEFGHVSTGVSMTRTLKIPPTNSHTGLSYTF